MTRIFFTHLVKKDLLIETKGVAIKEGRVADKHLVHNHTKRPPVAGFVVACLEKDLWCDVVRGSHGGIGKRSSRGLPALGPE